jgi:hypothetical protein
VADYGTVETAVRADLARMKLPEGESLALVELALSLAYRADNSTSARDLPGLSRELRNCLEELAKVKPAVSVSETPLERRRRERAARPATA